MKDPDPSLLPAAERQDPRTPLFLQGPPSLFWSELADAFAAAGHRPLRVNLCGGDFVLWRRRGAWNYRGSLANWKAWLTAFCLREGVTDILYYADRLPYHVIAKQVAAELGIKAYAVEFGYLRPDWLTLERDGMGVYSHFPTDPAVISAAAADLPLPEKHALYGYSFFDEAFHDVSFNLSMEFLRVLYPFYKSDKYYHPFMDYIIWLKRLWDARGAQAKAMAACDSLWANNTPYYLLALQLQSDYQIRDNSPYRHIAEMIDEVIGSFATKAEPDTRLVVKVHPLDNGYENWPKVVAATAARHGVADRVVCIDGGVLVSLLKRARGAIVINSTVALHAVQVGCPVKVMGVAVFDIPGITHQGPLDLFWNTPEDLDHKLIDSLVRLMAHTIQVKGSFYNKQGRRIAIAEFVRRIAAGTVNQPGAYVETPPRLDHARRLGVRVRI